MIVPLSGRQTECCSCRRKACFYNWKKSTQIKEFCSQGRNLQVNKHCDLFPKVCFRQTSPLCFLLCVQSSAEWCRHVELKIAPADVLWPYQTLINQTWHVLKTHFTSVCSRKFITLGNKFLVTNCFWGKISHFLLISRCWARIWQWKLEIGYGFWGIRKSLLYI